jgi:hypothetical protein
MHFEEKKKKFIIPRKTEDEKRRGAPRAADQMDKTDVKDENGRETKRIQIVLSLFLCAIFYKNSLYE